MGKNDKSDEEGQSSLEDFFGGSETDNSKSKEERKDTPQESEDSKSEPDRVTDESSLESSPPTGSSTAVFTVDDEDDLSIPEEEFTMDLRVGTRSIPKNLSPSILLSVDYDGAQNKAVARLYNPETKEIYFWFDNTNHKPYCYTDLPAQTVESMPGIRNNRGFLRAETVDLVDLLRDRPVKMTKVVGTDPLAIGGRAGAIRDSLRQDGVSRAWEANIRYRNCYTYDNNLVSGMTYKIVDGKLEPAPPVLDDSIMSQFAEIFSEDKGIARVINEYAPLFFTEVPDIRRLAVDIEVYTPVKNRVPDANTSPYPVTAIGLSDNEDFQKCFVLRRKGIDEGTKTTDFPDGLDIVYFESEADMLVEAFRIIDQYPIVLTFVGDAFDLNYMYHRAERLKIDLDRYCPIRMGRGNEIALLDQGVHVDLYRFLKNPSIRLYALSGAYERTNLDSIAKGLLDIGKLDLSTDISSLPYYELAHYCWLDANITLRITSYDNNLLLRLIILLMRISRLSMEDVTRLGISSWIQSLFRQEHRSRGNLIPRPADIETMKSSDAQTEAMIKDKRFKGAIVIEPIAGVHFNATVLDFASLYPTIMKRHNISYETVDCPHEECRIAENNRVPETDHWICTKRTGMISQTIGFFRDTRVDWFKSKSKDKSLEERTRNWYTVVEKALKVFVNACLPFDEEVVVRSSDGILKKCMIGSLENSWRGLEILSVHNELESPQFGKSTFTPIIGFTRSMESHTLEFTLDDGRVFQCTPNHMIPKLIRNPTRSKKQEPVETEYDVIEVSAEDIKLGDDLLILGTNYFSNTPLHHIFIPDYIDSSHLTVGMKRKDFKRFAHRKSKSVDSNLIQVIIDEFRYSKASKMYKARWANLSESAKETLRRDVDSVAPLYVKMTESTEQYREAGKWQSITIPLDDDFFSLMGWYLSEGHVGVNRVSFSQYVVVNPQNHQAICTTLTALGWPYATYSEKDIVVHSNVLAAVFESLCGIGSKNKRIPIELMNHQRATALLDSYFKGDGNFNTRGGRRYSTASKQLANDLVFLLGALGRYVSIHREEGMFRIVETKGYKYRRKHHGLVDFGDSLAARVKSIELSESTQPVFDMETGNGWFVTSNGVIVHNSYGVTGAQHFELFCMPAAESVTAYGRDAILRTKEKAESMGVRVLYGDTDSVFLDSPTIEQQEELIQWSSEDLKIDLEVEKTYKYVALSDRKKNYIGVLTSGYVEVKGLSGKKRNTPEFAQVAFQDMLEVLSRVDNPEGFETAKDEIREIINRVLDRLEGKTESFTPEDLAFRVQMTKSLDQYGDTKPMHVRAAQMLTDAGYDVPAGTIVEYIKVKGRDDILPVQMAKETDYWLDKDRYIDTLRSVFDQVLDSVGLNFDEMLGFTTLDQFF